MWAYLDKVCEVFDLRKYMTFNTRVTGAYWEEACGQWRVELSQTAPDGSQIVIEEKCHVLLNASGFLNKYKWPDTPGLDEFTGRVIISLMASEASGLSVLITNGRGQLIHTAAWPKDYQEEQWKGENVVVIGSGASSIQTVPGMQPHVKHMDVFVRTVSLRSGCTPLSVASYLDHPVYIGYMVRGHCGKPGRQLSLFGRREGEIQVRSAGAG